ncbi:MAG: hypothetical protein VYE73_08530 [Acidobacteriota bacterium]|nr:hypothetical protein [Acidobacteriota bacterium]
MLSVLRRALAQIAIGAIFGMPLAGLLFNVDTARELTWDTFGFTLATGTAVMAAVALLSCVGPSRRVLRIESSEALRVE